jgi:imidazolonepropionase-like amidohydrolase
VSEKVATDEVELPAPTPLLHPAAGVPEIIDTEEAFNAATINGAAALEVSNTHGSISVGKTANVILTKTTNSLAYRPYAFGENWIKSVFINGNIIT